MGLHIPRQGLLQELYSYRPCVYSCRCMHIDPLSSSALLESSTEVYVRITFKMDMYRVGASFTVQCYIGSGLQGSVGSWSRLPSITTAPAYAADWASATQPSYILSPFLAFWDGLYNVQLRPIALFSKLKVGLSCNKKPVQLFSSRFQETNTSVDPRLSGQTAKIMNSFYSRK